MAKTRSQASHSQVKKQEHEDKPKLEQLLRGTKNTSNNKNKITKKEKTATIKSIQAQIVTVKSENTDDNKVILALPMGTLRRLNITAKQIADLIGYIENDKMSICTAAKKTRMSYPTAQRYYQEHQGDPEHKIPLPRISLNKQSTKPTQKKIDELINYIAHDKMSLTQAACKVELNRKTAAEYYTKYMKDPGRKTPTLDISRSYLYKRCTQEDIKELIGYIVNNNMSVTAAARKVNMTTDTAKRYYLKYLEDPNHNIPVPGNPSSGSNKRCTDEQVKQMIGYIVNDRASLLEASFKADMSTNTAKKYYQQYLDDPNHGIPTPGTNHHCNSHKPPSLDQVKAFFSCMIIDNLDIKQASLKAKISKSTGQEYYTRYLKNPIKMEKSTDISYSVEKMKKLVECIQNDKMTIKSAAMNVSLCYDTARKYYRRYLKDPELGIPKVKRKQFTQENIKSLIDYIENHEMSIRSAAKKVKITVATAYKYYTEYQEDPEHRIPMPSIRGQYKKRKSIDTYSQLIADIYRNNPSIKPIHENHLPLPDMNIKLELLDENAQMILKDEK